MKPTFFVNQLEFRKWLEENHLKEKELIVGFYKLHSPKFNMTWSESVDQALCYGWIDGIRKSIDDESYCIRFTPRRGRSIWSTVNCNKVESLIKSGEMQQAGLNAYLNRKKETTGVYSFENEKQVLSEDFEMIFKTNELAWLFFNTQAKSYQKTVIHWITSAKQEKTQRLRLQKVIDESEKQMRL